MDPDMVRQQEEAEAAARLQAAQQPSLVPPLVHPGAPEPKEPLLFLERAQPTEPVRATRAELDYMVPPQSGEAALETGLPPAPKPVVQKEQMRTAAETSAPVAMPPTAPERFSAKPVLENDARQPTVSAPAELQTAVIPPSAPHDAAALSPRPDARRVGGWSAAFFCAVLTGAGIAGGIFAGVQLQLAVPQGVAIGALAGFILGWLSAAGRLWSQGISFGRAVRAPLTATLFVLLAELCALAVANTLPSGDFSAAIPTVGIIIAYTFALIGVRANIRE